MRHDAEPLFPIDGLWFDNFADVIFGPTVHNPLRHAGFVDGGQQRVAANVMHAIYLYLPLLAGQI